MQRSNEVMIYIGNLKNYAYISTKKSKTIVVFAFTSVLESLVLLYGDLA
jgi:hypothetical protein